MAMTDVEILQTWDEEMVYDVPIRDDQVVRAVRRFENKILEDAAVAWPKHQWTHMGKGTVQQIAVWLRARKSP